MPPLKTDLETFEDDLRGSEKTDVEFKTWMDISKADKKAQARIAQHIAAIANSGGGRLYFGVADDNVPQPLPQGFATEQYRSDNIHNLIRTRVHPLVQCEVRGIKYGETVYPMVQIPAHGTVPVLAKDDDGHMRVFVREIGPASVQASTYEQWDKLLKRCHRAREMEAIKESEEDTLAKTQAMTRAITDSVLAAILPMIERAADPAVKSASERFIELVEALAGDTRSDFVAQTKSLELSVDFGVGSRKTIAAMETDNVTYAYALLGKGGMPTTVQGLHSLLRRATGRMDEVANVGWSDFVVFTDPDSSPRTRAWSIGGRELVGVEGMRLDKVKSFWGSLDYWRAYGNGVFTLTKSYHEASHWPSSAGEIRFLTVVEELVRAHCFLAHAAVMSKMVEGTEEVIVTSDHRGLQDIVMLRELRAMRSLRGLPSAVPQFKTETRFAAEDLASDYFGCLKRFLTAFLDVFASAEFDPDDWMSRERVERLFDSLMRENSVLRLL